MALSALFVVSGVSATPAQAATGRSEYVEGSDPAAFLYDPLKINRIDITLPQESLRALAADSYSNQVKWQNGTAVFTTDGVQSAPMSIGTHIKGGWGSRRKLAVCNSTNCSVVTDQKPGLKVKFNFGDANKKQRFYGLKEITLNSMVQDQSMLHETVAYRIARAAGIPAPRTGYMRLYVNGRDLGLHMLLETYEKPLYKRWFTTGTQHSYEGAYWQDVINSSYGAMQMHEGDETQRDDLANIAQINSLSGKDWWDSINRFADMGEMTKMWAFEHFIEHWDAYSWFIINNYHVHFDGAGIMTMHPWGLDNTLREAGVGYTKTVAGNGQSAGSMFVKCIEYPTCLQLYQSSLAQVGEAAKVSNAVGFLDKVWNTINQDVMNDPIYWGGGAEWTKNEARNFLNNRHLTQSFVTAATTRKITNLSLYYEPPTEFAYGTQIEPLAGSNSDKAPRFAVLGDPANAKCSVDPATGTLTTLAPGTCVVSMTTPTGEHRPADGIIGYHYGYTLAHVNVGRLPAQLEISPIKLLTPGVGADVTVATNSTGSRSFKTTANCDYTDGVLTTYVASGTCELTVTIAADAQYNSVTKTIKVPIGKQVVTSYKVSKDPEWTTTTKLPKGATLTLIRKPSKVVGSCSIVATGVRANASSGYCTVTFASWTTSTATYAAKTFRINMSPNPQVWVSKVAASTYRKKLGTGKFTLANTDTPMTSAGQEGFFSYLGPCEVAQTAKATTVKMNGTGVCKVMLVASEGYKVAELTRTWTFTK